MLISLPWKWWRDFAEKGTRVVHLRLLISNVFDSSSDPVLCARAVEEMALSLADRTHYPQLESVYLPPLDSLPPDYRDPRIVHSLRSLSPACQSRSIEVVFEEQSDKDKAESQISEEFMRRMTKKKIERGTQE
jgi:hypothetical protein